MVACVMQSADTSQSMEKLNACCETRVEETGLKQETQVKDLGIVDKPKEGSDSDAREEGEIVDEFEMILSPEDEYHFVQNKILQFEDKNSDLEKISLISDNIANQYHYENFVPAPSSRNYLSYGERLPSICLVSDDSISSIEECLPFPQAPVISTRKHHRHRDKRIQNKKSHFINSFDCKHHTMGRRHGKRRRHHHHHPNCKRNQLELVEPLQGITDEESLGFDGQVDSNYDDDENEDDDRTFRNLKISRDKLRFALAHDGRNDVRPKYSLKERLQGRVRQSIERQSNHTFKTLNENENEEEPKQATPNHQQSQECETSKGKESPTELRLMALKSAILKKHLERKKRDEERAYSPTDMINRVHPSTAHSDLDDFMEISPLMSPDRAISPQELEPSVDTRPVDMELVDSDSGQNSQRWGDTWTPANNQMVPISDNGASMDWRFFSSNFPPPPVSMPIVIDVDDESEELNDSNETPPPPPSFHIPRMMLDDENARDAHALSNQDSLMDIQSMSMGNSRSLNNTQDSISEEAAALRAFLLSKRKPRRQSTNTPETELTPPDPKIEGDKNQINETGSTSDDPDELRMLLLSSIATKKKNKASDISPSILKQAVRRFQAQPTKDDNDDNSCTQPNIDEAAVDENDVKEIVDPIPIEDQEPTPLNKPVSPAATSSPDVSSNVYSAAASPVQPAVIKIVKPNKVINHNAHIKRKLTTPQTLAAKRPSTLLVKEPVAPLHVEQASGQAESTTRLISTVDPSSIKVNKLIINLGETSSDCDDEHLEMNAKSYYAVGYNSYSENGSPLTFAMDSASNSTTRSSTPNAELLDALPNQSNLRRTVINEYFEKKLDDFLKQARCNSTTELSTATSPEDKEIVASNETEKPMAQKKPLKQTPMAVRHLPVAAQREYLLLVERMRMLESKKNDIAIGSSTTQGTVKCVASTSVSTSNVSKLSTVITTKSMKVTTTKLNSQIASTNKKMQIIKKLLDTKKRNMISNSTTMKKIITPAKPVTIKGPNKAIIAKPNVTTSTPAIKTANRTPLVGATSSKMAIKTTATAPKTPVATAVNTTSTKLVTPNSSVSTNTVPTKNTIAIKAADSTSKLSQPINSKLKSASTVAATKAADKNKIGKLMTKTEKVPEQQPSKESRLKAFENSFIKIGGSVITNLEKSLQLVEQARKSKIGRLRSSQRLKELNEEMHNIKETIKQEELKLAGIQPELQATQEIIISLKQKRNKLLKAAVDLGKGLKGEDYRLMDDDKLEIRRKSTQLTKEIRFYNSILSYEDVAKMTTAQLTPLSPSLPPNDNNAEQPAERSVCIEQTPTDNTNQTTETKLPSEVAATKTAEKRDNAKATDTSDEVETSVRLPTHSHTMMKELREDDDKDAATPLKKMESTLLEYRTPEMMGNYNSQVDVNAMMCPFGLMGRCEDTDCSYMHLSNNLSSENAS